MVNIQMRQSTRQKHRSRPSSRGRTITTEAFSRAFSNSLCKTPRWSPANRLAGALSLLPLLLAQAAPSPADRLEPAQRAKLFGTLALLALGGVAMVVLAWLALRVGRRSSRREDLAAEMLRKKRADVDDWAAKKLIDPMAEDTDEVTR